MDDSATTVRLATLCDVSVIGEFCRRITHETYADWAESTEVRAWATESYRDGAIKARLADPNCLLLACLSRTQLVATAYAEVGHQDYGADGYLGGLHVDPEWRRRGLGSRLLDLRLTWLSHQRTKRVLTTVVERNQAALSLLQAHGFYVVAQAAGSFMPSLPRAHLCLDLRQTMA